LVYEFEQIVSLTLKSGKRIFSQTIQAEKNAGKEGRFTPAQDSSTLNKTDHIQV
jgi:hypothetical protein